MIFGKKTKLLQWQNDVFPDAPKDKLVFKEKQLLDITKNLAETDSRVIQNCLNIISETIDPEVYFSRYYLMLDKATHLTFLEKYLSFDVSPSAAVEEIKIKKQISINRFLLRCEASIYEKKTEKGRTNQRKRIYDSLQPYLNEMNEENLAFVHSALTPLTHL